MSLSRRALLAAAVAAATAIPALALAADRLQPNAPAPVFSATGTKGETVDLAALRGRPVILEWTNHDCPFVRKHYGAGNMQALQREAAEAGAVWISVISSAPGEQGHVLADEANALTETREAAPAHVVLDPEGTIGKMYGAVTTPHMYVITPEGDIAFMGGIDDKPTADRADIPGATNFVRAALEALAEGRAPEVQFARPYGCSVKYAS